MRGKTALLAALVLMTPWVLPPTLADDLIPGLLISDVHVGGSTDWEAVRIVNLDDDPVDLSGWSLGDGEGIWTVPEGSHIPPGKRASVGINTSAHDLLWGRPLDIIASKAGSFGLADRGDSLVLLDPDGEVVDQLAYGEASGESPPGWTGYPVPTPRTMPWGRLLTRSSLVDTDTATDWMGWTEPRCGWLDSPPAPTTFDGNVSCFVTPEQGWEVLSWAIGSAEEELAIALYEITSMDLASLVSQKAKWGVRTRLLVEGTPVGMSEEEAEWRGSILSSLIGDGVEVWMTVPTVKGESHRPYRYHHEKYCVIDGETVVVTTENWITGSFPRYPPVEFGSRGWGAVVKSPGLANDLMDVFEHDLRLSARRFEVRSAETLSLRAPGGPSVGPPDLVPGEVRLLVGPEGWGTDLDHLLAPIREAEDDILLELAYLDLWWGDQLSPIVEELLMAAARGVAVRLVLDPNVNGEGRETLEALHAVASGRGVTGLRGVIADDLTDASRVHAKGAVIDGRTAFLGSLNWARSSVVRNREVVVIVESTKAVATLKASFEADWNASVSGMAPSPPRSLIVEAALRWQGRTFPHLTMEPIGRPAAADEDHHINDGASRMELFKIFMVLVLVVVVRALNKRYAITTRAWHWVVKRLDRASKALLSLSPRPSSREEAPDAPRTTCQGMDPPRRSSPGPPEPPGPPPRHRPRVVFLEEEAQW
jgi:phosphatidylserine/phosphatidylglycerophosphate/cardiolipin synthase-like enzyme